MGKLTPTREVGLASAKFVKLGRGLARVGPTVSGDFLFCWRDFCYFWVVKVRQNVFFSPCRPFRQRPTKIPPCRCAFGRKTRRSQECEIRVVGVGARSRGAAGSCGGEGGLLCGSRRQNSPTIPVLRPQLAGRPSEGGVGVVTRRIRWKFVRH